MYLIMFGDFIGAGLPVLVSDPDLEKYPEFKKLLKSLTRYVADDGTTKDIQKDYTEVCNERNFINDRDNIL